MTFAIPFFLVHIFTRANSFLYFCEWKKKTHFFPTIWPARVRYFYLHVVRVATLLLRDACSWNFKPDNALLLPVVGSYNSKRRKSFVHPSRMQLSSSLLHKFSLPCDVLTHLIFALLRGNVSISFEKLIYLRRAITLFLELSHLLTGGIWRVEISEGWSAPKYHLYEKTGLVLS